MFHKFNGNKLRALRQNYGLTHQQLSKMLSLKSKGNLAMMESGATLPQMSNFLLIVDFFGISADWLLNRTLEVYDEETIKNLETKLSWGSKYVFYEGTDSPPDDPIKEWNPLGIEELARSYYRVLIYAIIEKVGDKFLIYNDDSRRKKEFSIEVRANIVFSMQVLKFFCLNLAKIVRENNLPEPGQLTGDKFDNYVKQFLADEDKWWKEMRDCFLKQESVRAANSWFVLFRNCYDLLEKYWAQTIDLKEPQYHISPF